MPCLGLLSLAEIEQTIAALTDAAQVIEWRTSEDGERFAIGALEGEVMSVPGHTPACVAYKVGDAVFVGDTLFMPDVGTARCDFPGGDAHTLYRSVRKLLSLPSDTRLFMCHDYPPNGRPVAFECTVADQRAHMQGSIELPGGVQRTKCLHDRLAVLVRVGLEVRPLRVEVANVEEAIRPHAAETIDRLVAAIADRKSTRLNSSHRT